MEHFRTLPVTLEQQEFEEGLELACDINTRTLTANTPDGRKPVSKTFHNFVPAIVYYNSAGKPIWAPLRSLDPKFVTRGVPDPKVLWDFPKIEETKIEPRFHEDLSDLRSAMLLKTLADEAAELNEDSLTVYYQSQADKMTEPDILVNSDEQEEITNKINEARAWVLNHGEEKVIPDPGGVVHYKTASVGIFSAEADIEDSLDNAYLSIFAEDGENNVKVNLVVSEDLKTYELEIKFTNVAKSIELRFSSYDKTFDKMTAKEYRILSQYLDQFIKAANKSLPDPNQSE